MVVDAWFAKGCHLVRDRALKSPGRIDELGHRWFLMNEVVEVCASVLDIRVKGTIFD